VQDVATIYDIVATATVTILIESPPNFSHQSIQMVSESSDLGKIPEKSIPDANHGAGICAYICSKHGPVL